MPCHLVGGLLSGVYLMQWGHAWVEQLCNVLLEPWCVHVILWICTSGFPGLCKAVAQPCMFSVCKPSCKVLVIRLDKQMRVLWLTCTALGHHESLGCVTVLPRIRGPHDEQSCPA